MSLKLHNSLTKRKEDFAPRDPARVTMYVCGPTVYNYAHIGNARPAVVFDVLFRVLRRLYGEDAVVYARNVTDVDDKINAKAADEGVAIGVVTDRYLAAYHEDIAKLGVLRPTIEPHATNHIGQMSALIERLLDAGAAYESQGDVLFDVAAYEAKGGQYGALSGRNLDDLIAGARVEVADNKRHPADFVLWKPSKSGEPEWTGPRGLKGRPGWHIECSAMIEANLGLPIDIHGGGHDLIFPHHTNEIAQSCAAHGARDPADYARVWLHNGFLTMDAEKMSKSLGNVLLVHELVESFPGEVIRWALLSAHYRAPLDWTDALLEQSRKSLDRLYGMLQRAKAALKGFDYQPTVWSGQIALAVDRFMAVLSDDLNTPRAFAELFDIQTDEQGCPVGIGAGLDLEAMLEAEHDFDKRNLIGISRDVLVLCGAALGLLQQDPDAWFSGGADDGLKAQVEALLERRKAVRAAKDWPAADAIRAELDALGVVVMDGPQGASWRMK